MLKAFSFFSKNVKIYTIWQIVTKIIIFKSLNWEGLGTRPPLKVVLRKSGNHKIGDIDEKNYMYTYMKNEQ